MIKFYIRNNFEFKGSFFLDKGSYRSGIFPDPDPGDPKRPDPTKSGSGSATLGTTHVHNKNIASI